MMKRIFLLTAFLLVNSHVSAEGYYNQMSNSLKSVGRSIEGVNIPVIGKLTNLLPFALVVSGLKECPIQTMIVVVGFCAYLLSNNDTVKAKLQEYRLRLRKKNEPAKSVIDETLFIFEGDDEYDAEYDDNMEDELLFPDDEHEKQHTKQRKENKNSARKF